MSELLAGADISGLPQRGKVVVGFSGGADSTALAHWLLGRLGPERLVLAHVNHQLRGEESDRDEAAARAFAQRFGLDFALRREDVAALARRRGLGLEECGRQVRYELLPQPGAGGGGPDPHRPPRRGQRRRRCCCTCAGGPPWGGCCGIPARRGKVLRPLLRVHPGGGGGLLPGSTACPTVTDSSSTSPGSSPATGCGWRWCPVLAAAQPRAVRRRWPGWRRALSRDRAFLTWRPRPRRLLEACRAPLGAGGRQAAHRGPSRPWPGRRAASCGGPGWEARPWRRSTWTPCSRCLRQGGRVDLPGGGPGPAAPRGCSPWSEPGGLSGVFRGGWAWGTTPLPCGKDAGFAR